MCLNTTRSEKNETGAGPLTRENNLHAAMKKIKQIKFVWSVVGQIVNGG